MSTILTGDAKRRECSLSAHPPASHGAWLSGLEGQGSVQEAGNKGSTAWRQEPGCADLDSGCVTLGGSVALSELQFHLKVEELQRGLVFPDGKRLPGTEQCQEMA